MQRLWGIILSCCILLGTTACGTPAIQPQESETVPAPGAEVPVESAQTYEYSTQELFCENQGQQIYGVINIPVGIETPMPAVIYSHGYGATHQNGDDYVRALAEMGYVTYSFDFRGGSTNSRSEGSPLEMSIFTQQSDLEAVMEMLCELDCVDSENLFLLGASQGGLVSVITAADNVEKVRGLMLLYPAFHATDTVAEMFSSVEEIPETVPFLWMTVGRFYFEDLIGYDVYQYIGGYDKDVLIIHGDQDGIVPISYSEKALEVYPSAELEVIPGAGHGFSGDAVQQAIQFMAEYLQEHISAKAGHTES